jgi:hypothetical protein
MLVINAMLSVVMAFTPLSQDPSSYEWNKKSTLTVERQVEFPGLVLEPGTYIIKLKEAGEKRSQVEILNQDETQTLGTVVAIPDHRMRPEDQSEFLYHEVKGDGPAPIRSWFFSGDLVGLEFVYPVARAREIAKDTDDHVVASNNSKDSAIVAVTPNGKEIVLDEGPAAQTARRKPQ